MFQFPPLSSTRLFYSAGDGPALPEPGCPIRKSTSQSLFATHRSFSQLTTSFIGFPCQGIHHTLLVT